MPLEEFAFYKRFIQKRKPLLHTIPEVLEDVWEHRLKASMGTLSDSDCNNHQVQTLDDYYDVQVVDEAKPSRIGDLQLAIRRTRHFLPCFGMRLTCAGLTLGYSSDTVFDPNHIEFLAESDVIIHETSSGAGHPPAGKLAELPDDIRKKLYLVHIADHFDVAKCPLPVLEEEARGPGGAQQQSAREHPQLHRHPVRRAVGGRVRREHAGPGVAGGEAVPSVLLVSGGCADDAAGEAPGCRPP